MMHCPARRILPENPRIMGKRRRICDAGMICEDKIYIFLFD